MSDPAPASGTTKQAFAARFSPTVGTSTDASFRVGNAEIVKYLDSPSRAAEKELAAFENKMHMSMSDNFSRNYRFQPEMVELSCYSDASCAEVFSENGATIE